MHTPVLAKRGSSQKLHSFIKKRVENTTISISGASCLIFDNLHLTYKNQTGRFIPVWYGNQLCCWQLMLIKTSPLPNPHYWFNFQLAIEKCLNNLNSMLDEFLQELPCLLFPFRATTEYHPCNSHIINYVRMVKNNIADQQMFNCSTSSEDKHIKKKSSALDDWKP